MRVKEGGKLKVVGSLEKIWFFIRVTHEIVFFMLTNEHLNICTIRWRLLVTSI